MDKYNHSFTISYDFEEMTKELNNEQLGRLLRGIFAFEKRHENIDFSDDENVNNCFVKYKGE